MCFVALLHLFWVPLIYRQLNKEELVLSELTDPSVYKTNPEFTRSINNRQPHNYSILIQVPQFTITCIIIKRRNKNFLRKHFNLSNLIYF